MRLFARKTRPAFSLLEMVLALALGMLLLLALYLTLNTYIVSAKAGRETVAEGTLARNILNRIASDITGQLGPVDPRGSAPAGGASTAATTTPTDPASSTTTDPAATTTDATATSGQTSVTFNNGVRGDATSLTLSGFRVQKPRVVAPGQADDSAEITSDLRRIRYWLSVNGNDTLGLGRAEYKQATGADIDTDPVQLDDQEKYIFAAEVKSVTFEYFDGTTRTWQASWDGSAPGDANGTPLGPPAAIRISITLRRFARGTPGADTEADGPTYQHIVALPTSNSFTPKTGSE